MSDQLGLLEWQDTRPGRGETFDCDRDERRLAAQFLRVRQFVVNTGWHTLSEIAAATKDPEASVSARLRQLRSAGYTVEREFVSRGLFRYRVSPSMVGAG